MKKKFSEFFETHFTTQKKIQSNIEREMNDILEGFEEILDDLKEFPDKGKINALTKMVRFPC